MHVSAAGPVTCSLKQADILHSRKPWGYGRGLGQLARKRGKRITLGNVSFPISLDSIALVQKQVVQLLAVTLSQAPG